MFNLNRLRKDQILWLGNHRCKHGIPYLQHPNCFEKEKPDSSPIYERIAFLDIESFGLWANWDCVASYCIVDNEGRVTGRSLTSKEALNWNVLDKKLMQEFAEGIQDFDVVVVFWGSNHRHDLPFLRTRCIHWGIEFPLWGSLRVIDLYDVCKNKLRMNSNRLGNVCKFLGIPAKEHDLDGSVWQRAKLGDKESLNYVWLHNKEDSFSTKVLFEKLKEFRSNTKSSV